MQPFSYTRASDRNAAIAAADRERAQPPVMAPVQYLAGGTTILDLMKLDVMRPEKLVDINGLKSMHGAVEASAKGLRLRAPAHMSDVAEHPAIMRDYPVIAQSLHLAASQQLRNMATLGGNVLQRTRCNYF